MLVTMFDGTFSRTDLTAALETVKHASDVHMNLHEYWPCTITANRGSLKITVTLLAWWARGGISVALSSAAQQQIADELAAITIENVWLHGEPGHIQAQPSQAD